jgi:hypothetical protein
MVRGVLIMRELLLIAGVAGCMAWAQDAKPNLSGTWQLDSAKSEMSSSKSSVLTWLIQEKAGSIEMKQVEKDGSGHERQAAFTCGTAGKECAVKELDGPVKASFWYNGPMLVEMRTHNDHVSKYRMKLGDDGKTLNVEMMSIAPPSDKAEHLVFTKQQ